MFKNILNVSCIMIAVLSNNKSLFLASCLVYFINSVLSVLLIVNNKDIVKFDIKKVLAVIGSILIYPISLGTFYGCVKLFKYIFTSRVKMYRTER